MKMVDTKSDAPFRVRVNPTGRRTFSRDYKREIVEECNAGGASVSGVALSHRIYANQVRKWIVQYRAGRLDSVAKATPTMLPVTLKSAARPSLLARSQPPARRSSYGAGSVIDIELDGVRIHVRGTVDGAALRTVLDALANDDRAAGGHACVAGGRRHRHAQRHGRPGGAGADRTG
jgi:transposase-like protein